MRRILICVIPFLIILSCQKSNVSDLSFNGKWFYSNSYISFSIELFQEDKDKIFGFHSAIKNDGSRIDEVVADYFEDPSIRCSIKENVAIGIFKSGYSDVTADIKLTLRKDGTLNWKIINRTDGEIYVPEEAILKRVDKEVNNKWKKDFIKKANSIRKNIEKNINKYKKVEISSAYEKDGDIVFQYIDNNTLKKLSIESSGDSGKCLREYYFNFNNNEENIVVVVETISIYNLDTSKVETDIYIIYFKGKELIEIIKNNKVLDKDDKEFKDIFKTKEFYNNEIEEYSPLG